jgi:hypothetical protein
MREPVYDDTRCATCHTPLPDNPPEDGWAFHGFCHAGCALSCPEGFYLTGTPAIELAEARGGPGFERPLVRRWIDGAQPNAPVMLARLDSAAALPPANAPAQASWCWRLQSGGVCHAMRLTSKEGL